MNKTITFLLCFCATVITAQQLPVIDSLMLNAAYETALVSIEARQKDATPSQRLMLQNKRAQALIYLGKFDEASKALDDFSGQGNGFVNAVRLTNYGLLYMNQGRYDQAEQSLQLAIDEFEKSGEGSSLEAAHAISSLGLVYNATGAYAKAKEQLMMALAKREKLVRGNHELIAASFNDLGLAYANIDNDKALDYYEKALKIYQAVHGKDHPKIAVASINNGFIYRKLELYGDAVNNFENALRIWEKIYPSAHPTKAFALMNLGETYQRMDNTKAARGYYERALVLYRESYGDKHPEIAQVLNALGNMEMGSGNLDASINLFQQAITANVNGFQSLDETTNPRLENFYNGYILLYSMLYKAQAFEKRYLQESLKLTDLEDGLRTLQSCDTLIDRLRQQNTNESDKISLGVIANGVYENGVRIASEAALNAFRKRMFRELAFYFAEKSKSAVLLESISDSNAKTFAGIPTALMEEEQELKTAISLATQKLSQKPSLEEEKKLRESAYNLNRRYEAFTEKLERDFPEYFNLKFNSASPSIGQIQKILDDETALISYFIDEGEARLYTFLITKSRFRIHERTIPKEFDKYVTGLRNSIYFSAQKDYVLTASKLGDLLIPPIPAGIKALVILPTGRLSVVPFEALLTTAKVKDKKFSNLPYLINDFSVRYEFSASLLLQKASNKAITTAPSILLFAPVTFSASGGLPELPGTESEVREISSLFAGRNMNASVHVHDAASEMLIKENKISGYNLLHLATHGVVDESNPELSRIFLQPTPASEDGNLYSGEIYNLKLNANLVTLSACQTGLGKISKGEGVIGLSRALVYAGARNIIVSYWSVADDSTSELMKHFYTSLLEKADMSSYHTSLQKAKIMLRNQEKFSAPYYWAPFILIGF